MRRALLIAVAVLELLGGVALAGGTLSFSVNHQELGAPVYAEVYNTSISVPANGSITVSVSPPANWSKSDVAALHVVAVNVTHTLSLSARDANGTALASATIVPLSTEYEVTLPPRTRDIVITNSGDQVAQGRLIVYVESKPVRFALEMPGEAHVEIGTATYVHGVIKQLEGPAGLIWAQWNRPAPLNVTVYWGRLENGTPPSKAVPASVEKMTSGAGWQQNFTILLDAGRVTQETNFNVQIAWLYASDYDEASQLVATIDLAGQVTDQPVIAGVAAGKGRIAAAALALVSLMIVGAVLVSRR